MLLEELQHGHDLVVDGARSQPLLVAVRHEVEHIVSCRILDVFLLVRSAQERIERVAIGEVGARLALHPHVAQIGVDGIADLGLGRDFGFRLGGSNETVANGAKFDRLTAGLVYRVLAGDRCAASLPALAPLDVVGAFDMDFDLAVDADFVFQTTVRFGNDGRKTPGVIDFDLLDEVDAIRVIGSVERGAVGLQSRHAHILLLGPFSLSKLSQSGHQTGHQGGKLLIPKVAG